MAESNTSKRFRRFLSRLRSARPLDEADSDSVSHLAVDYENRKEEPIHYNNQAKAQDEFYRNGFRTFPTAEAGLASMGWKELPAGSGPEIKEGRDAHILLAYKLSDCGLPFESRHICLAKIQNLTYPDRLWAEVEILRGLVHEHIVGFRGMFGVDPECNKRKATTEKDNRLLWLLLEYASAGDLGKEVKRFEKKSIDEPGSRYYMLQICSGVGYMHSKAIIHGDLHPGNILLKYKPDGTKTCLICDFGWSEIIKPFKDIHDMTFRSEIISLTGILRYMMSKIEEKSAEAEQILSGRRAGFPVPTTVTHFLTFPWFDGPVRAPIPKSPSPLLPPEVVRQIGYLPPVGSTESVSPPVEPLTESPGRVPDSARKTFAQRLRQRFTSAPRPVKERAGSPLWGAEEAEREDTKYEEFAFGHSPPAGPSRGRRQQQADDEEKAESRPSVGSRIRDRMRSMGQAIARPFRKSSRRPDH